jgi:PKD repeat protein
MWSLPLKLPRSLICQIHLAMNKTLHSLLPLLTLLLSATGIKAQCNAAFAWEQIPGTLTIHFNNNSTSEFDIVSNVWNFGDGDMGDGVNPNHTYDIPANYLVCLVITDTEGCVSDVCHEVTVEAVSSECNADFVWEQIPGTLTIHFNNNSTSEFDIVSNLWSFGDGEIGDGVNPNHTYDQPGNYPVCLIITDAVGCVSEVCHEVTVEAVSSECNAQFNWEQLSNTLQIHFHSTSSSQYDIVSYNWNFGDGTEGDGSNPYHTYDEPGNYLVCLIITDAEGCVSDVCHEVTVEGLPSECHAAFIWEQFGGTLEVDFQSTSTSDDDIISYVWHFGDGTEGDGVNPSHTYSEPGTYLVCLIITNAEGCVSDVCHEVTVTTPGGDCEAQFNWEQIPGTLQIHFNSTSTSQNDIVSYHWNFGDGHEGDGNDPYHTYEEPGNYLVCLIITDSEGCISDVCHEVTILPLEESCHAQFNWEQIPGTLQIHFNSTSTSPNDIVSYHWNFGDGTEGDGNDPYHTYENPGTYVVCLIITDSEGCISDVCHEVTIGEPEGNCHAQFTWDTIPGTLNIHFFSQSTSENDIVSYHWTFGDGHDSNDQNPTHEYSEPGVYVVCLRIEDNEGCVSEICHEVVVGEEEEDCQAAFEWELIPGTLGVHFINHSTSPNDIVSIHWTFGDGQDSNDQSPSHEYSEPGVYLVCLRIEDATGCVSELCHEVVVGEQEEDCQAAFTWEQIPGSLQIHFFSTSTSAHDIVSYVWHFGDGDEGDGNDPYHTYDEAGTYLVCLIITDASGCVSDVCHEVTVGSPEEECEAAFNFETNNDGIVFFNNNSTGVTPHATWLWNFGDGTTSTEENPHHDYGDPGIYTVCLTISDTTNGCEDEYCLTIVYEMAWEDLHYDEMGEAAQSTFSTSSLLSPDVTIIRYTNPAAETIYVDYFLEEASKVTIALFDLTGKRLISDYTAHQPKGRQQHALQIGQYHPGMYILSVTTDTMQKTMGVTISR